jgi:hypothetical protein
MLVHGEKMGRREEVKEARANCSHIIAGNDAGGHVNILVIFPPHSNRQVRISDCLWHRTLSGRRWLQHWPFFTEPTAKTATHLGFCQAQPFIPTHRHWTDHGPFSIRLACDREGVRETA